MTELLNRNLLSLDPHDPQRFVALAKNTEDCLLLTLSEQIGRASCRERV